MSNIVLDIENVSKQYRLGEVGTGTLSHDLNRWWHKARGKEDPYLKIGEANDRTKKGESDYVWALRDISFKIEQGQAVGIIGRNGAGKSTLLKLLSKVTKPTTGSIKYKGRIASLLEVGTGFHPEMTGRENIYLNGAILGMTRKEITRKFDEIVDFAGVERYIDTPVKRYSSGMYVRLAFAVAAYLESEILIVDEVLAVGDAEFQKKCLGKMGDITSSEGRTILFVSHNIGAVKRLCNSGIVLDHGMVKAEGEINKMIDFYTKSNLSVTGERKAKFYNKKNNTIFLNSIELNTAEQKQLIDITEKLNVKIDYTVKEPISGVNVEFILIKEGEVLFRTWDVDGTPSLLETRQPGKYTTEFNLPKFLLPGIYAINIAVGIVGHGLLEFHEECLTFEIDDLTNDQVTTSFSRGGMVMYTPEWSLTKKNNV